MIFQSERSKLRSMKTLILIAFGGALGALSRHGVSVGFMRLVGPGFPYATIAVNIFGSFLMGCLAGYFLQNGVSSQPIKLFLTVGFLGAFTTFSTFSLDTITLFERGEVMPALSYVLASVFLSVFGLWLGFFLFKGGVPS